MKRQRNLERFQPVESKSTSQPPAEHSRIQQSHEAWFNELTYNKQTWAYETYEHYRNLREARANHELVNRTKAKAIEEACVAYGVLICKAKITGNLMYLPSLQDFLAKVVQGEFVTKFEKGQP